MSMSNAATHLMPSLHAAFGKRAALAALLGDTRPVRALRLARLVYDQVPALFPEFAADLVEGDVRPACWSLACLVADMPGAWDIWVEARDIAV